MLSLVSHCLIEGFYARKLKSLWVKLSWNYESLKKFIWVLVEWKSLLNLGHNRIKVKSQLPVAFIQISSFWKQKIWRALQDFAGCFVSWRGLRAQSTFQIGKLASYLFPFQTNSRILVRLHFLQMKDRRQSFVVVQFRDVKRQKSFSETLRRVYKYLKQMLAGEQ